MASSNYIAILILAAGASSRMKKTKQLLPWENTTLIGKAIRTAKASAADSITVVLGAKAALIREAISKENIHCIENTKWQIGLGSSIAFGTKFIIKNEPRTNAILVMLADQPLIDVAYIDKMLYTFVDKGEGVATAYMKRAGVPALFPRSYFKKLATLHNDFGAKDIINNPEDSFLVIEPGSKTRDVDTESDYNALIDDFK